MNDVTRYVPQPVAITSPVTVSTTPRYVPQQRTAPSPPAVVEWSGQDQQALDSFEATLQVYVRDPDDRQRVLMAAKDWYQDLLRATAKTDQRDIKQCLAQLKSSWGPDFNPRMKLLDQLMDDLPENVAVPLYEARDEDGTLLLNNPAVATFLVMAKRAIDQDEPQARRIATDATELEQLEQLMRDVNGPYWKGPRAERLQARYRELLGE